MSNWFELIVGILEICIGIYFTQKGNEARYIFFMLGGFHIANGLKGFEDK